MADTTYTDGRGRFKPGNPGGPGNPQIRKLAEYKKAIHQAVKLKDLKEVIQKLLELAKDGDVQAARLILERCLGKTPDTMFVKGDGMQNISIVMEKEK